MFESVNVIGRGRVGSAVAARLRERGVALSEDDAELVLLCVPDTAIADVAPGTGPGPWVAHVCGATPLAALDPHERRFASTRCRRSPLARRRAARRRLGGGHRESDEARRAAASSRARSGCSRSTWPTTARTLYHAGAAFASNYLVTLHRAAARLLRAAGAPPEALVPLMTRTIENGFELTGPIARGDWATVDAHMRAIHDEAPGARAHLRRARGGDGSA